MPRGNEPDIRVQRWEGNSGENRLFRQDGRLSAPGAEAGNTCWLISSVLFYFPFLFPELSVRGLAGAQNLVRLMT